MENSIKENINEVEKKSTELSYPEYIKSLKDIGVASYEVDVSNHNKLFKSTSGQELSLLGQLLETKCSDEFNTDKIIQAVNSKNQGMSDYSTLLKELADAGVCTFFVDLKNMCVRYKGAKQGQEYIEKIPDAI